MKKILLTLFIFFSFSLIFFPSATLAFGWDSITDPYGEVDPLNDEFPAGENVCDYTKGFINEVASPIVVAAFTIMMIYAGIQYAAGGANKDSVEHAKETVVVATGGVVLYLLAYVIVTQILGSDPECITRF